MRQWHHRGSHRCKQQVLGQYISYTGCGSDIRQVMVKSAGVVCSQRFEPVCRNTDDGIRVGKPHTIRSLSPERLYVNDLAECLRVAMPQPVTNGPRHIAFLAL